MDVRDWCRGRMVAVCKCDLVESLVDGALISCTHGLDRGGNSVIEGCGSSE